MDSILVEMTAIGTIAVTLFGAAFCFMQSRHSQVHQSFAVFLIAIAINNLPDAFRQYFTTLPSRYETAADLVTWPSSFLLAPLFWLYVLRLTSSQQERERRLFWHLALPTASVIAAVLVLLSPPEIREGLFSDDPPMDTASGIAFVVIMGSLHLALFPQMAFYLFLILRRLARFRLKLRDYYSSTERYELRWIYVIGGLGVLFWSANTLLLFIVAGYGQASLWAVNLASVAGFILVSAIALWGIRQHPPLAPDTEDSSTPSKIQTPGKYEKSALSSEASERLSRKLRNAMEVDQLHRDANLSLWGLASHIGASSNYISQTLNEVIGESFFDFVNAYRIAEAKRLLTTTNESVLNITYDVGFNARSSFYNAFKRHTGQTPTSYRKKMSNPEGMDDMTRQIKDT